MAMSGLLSQMERTDQTFKGKGENKIIIDQRFLIQKLSIRTQSYNMYEGIDIEQQKFVNIYIKPFSSSENSFSKNIKQQFRSKVAPVTIWTGPQKIQKTLYFIEVQQKYGPSFKKMFSHIKERITDKGFIHLFYQLLKLIEKISSGNYVHRQLTPQMIVFDSNPQKNDLYILNCFCLKKKNQECARIYTKYCSKGSHLGLNAHIKDDLQSICYILLDIFSSGQFLKNQTPEQYQSAKIGLNPRQVCKQIPQVFVDFYYYVANLNYTDQINFFNWKNQILKHISKQIIAKPYQWMIKGKKKQKQQHVQPIEDQWKEQEDHVVSKIQKLKFKTNEKPKQ